MPPEVLYLITYDQLSRLIKTKDLHERLAIIEEIVSKPCYFPKGREENP